MSNKTRNFQMKRMRGGDIQTKRQKQQHRQCLCTGYNNTSQNDDKSITSFLLMSPFCARRRAESTRSKPTEQTVQ